MAKFLFSPTIHSEKVITARVGGNAVGTRANDNDVGKPVKLGGDSNYVLCAVGDVIEGVVTSIETGLYDGFSLGGVVRSGYLYAVADGSEAAGTGAVAVGDWVVAGTADAIQTAKAAGHLKVRKATTQGAQAPVSARVVSLPEGSGAVGKLVLIELL